MRCPVCASSGSLGLLQRIRKGKTVHARYFCRNCCSEICYENQELTSVLSIDEDGEVIRSQPPVIWQPRFGTV